MKTILFCFLALCAFTFGGCTKNGTIASPPVGATYDDDFEMDGGQYHNTDIEIKNVSSSSGDSKPNGATYTEVQVSGSSDTITSIQWDIKFNGTTTNTYNCDKSSNTVVVITITTKSSSTAVVYTSVDNSASVICTKYDDKGGKIKGTFSGKFTSDKGDTYTVVKASFSVTRTS